MLNQILGLEAVKAQLVSIDHLRTDTTVTECNIHWPTDSSLLWDTYRVIAREMSRVRQIEPLSCCWRFHAKKIKKRHLFVTRYAGSTSKRRLRQVRRDMKTLIVRVEEVLEKAGHFVAWAESSRRLELMALADYLPVMRQVASVARRRAFDGSISCLKRAFRLARCCFRGFKNFASAVGSAVFCHNLTILAKNPGG